MICQITSFSSDLILFFISLILLLSACIIVTHTLLVTWVKTSKKRFAWQFQSYIFTLSLLCLLSTTVNCIMASHLWLQVGRCFYTRKTFPLDFFSTTFVTLWILTCTAFYFYIPIIKLSMGHLAPTNILLGTCVLFGFRESISLRTAIPFVSQVSSALGLKIYKPYLSHHYLSIVLSCVAFQMLL